MSANIIIDQVYDQTTFVKNFDIKDDDATDENFSDLMDRSSTQLSSPLVAAKFCKFIGVLALYLENQVAIETVRDTILDIILAKYATTAESLEMVAGAISRITGASVEGQILFSSEASVSAIVEALNMHGTNTSAETLEHFANAICVIVNIPDGQKHFSSTKASEAIEAALKYATTSASVEALAFAIRCIVHGNPSSLQVFSRLTFIEELQKSAKYAFTCTSKCELERTLNPLITKLEMDFAAISSLS